MNWKKNITNKINQFSRIGVSTIDCRQGSQSPHTSPSIVTLQPKQTDEWFTEFHVNRTGLSELPNIIQTSNISLRLLMTSHNIVSELSRRQQRGKVIHIKWNIDIGRCCPAQGANRQKKANIILYLDCIHFGGISIFFSLTSEIWRNFLCALEWRGRMTWVGVNRSFWPMVSLTGILDEKIMCWMWMRPLARQPVFKPTSFKSAEAEERIDWKRALRQQQHIFGVLVKCHVKIRRSTRD